MQWRFVGTHACVAADQLQLTHWHIQGGFVGVFEVQKFLQGGGPVFIFFAQIHVDQTPVASNAVLAVHHRIAHIELAQVFDQGFNIADLLLLFAAARGGSGRKKFGFGDQVDALLEPMKTADQRRCGHSHFFVAGQKFLQVVKHRRCQAAGTYKVQQALTAAIAFSQDQHSIRAAADVRLQACQRVLGAAHHGQLRQGLSQSVVINIGSH